MNNKDHETLDLCADMLNKAIESQDNVGLDKLGQALVEGIRGERKRNGGRLSLDNISRWKNIYDALIVLRQDCDKSVLNLPHEIDTAMGVLDYSLTATFVDV